MKEKVAVVVPITEVQSLVNYLSTKAYSEVAGIFEAIPKWPGITQEQVDMLLSPPDPAEDE
jgi:hypothetical protein